MAKKSWDIETQIEENEAFRNNCINVSMFLSFIGSTISLFTESLLGSGLHALNLVGLVYMIQKEEVDLSDKQIMNLIHFVLHSMAVLFVNIVIKFSC